MNTAYMCFAWPLAFLCLASCTYKPTDHGRAKEPGFIEAYFDASTLEGLMADKDCAALHFYAIHRSDDDVSGSVMAMPADRLGLELYNYFVGPWYAAYEELDESRALTRGLTKDDALEAMANLRDDGFRCYAVAFTTEELANVLRTKECNGVRLTPERTADGRYWTMRMTPVAIKEGAARTVGDERETAVCTEPCPTYCGHSSYLPME